MLERGERVVMVRSMLASTVVLSSVSTWLETTVVGPLVWELTRLRVLVSTGRGGGGGKSINIGKYF